MSPLPCPFCGGPAIVSAAGNSPMLPYFVRCDCVECIGWDSRRGSSSVIAAVTAWNRRASPRDSGSAGSAPLISAVANRWIRNGEVLALSLTGDGRLQCDALNFDHASARLALRDAKVPD